MVFARVTIPGSDADQLWQLIEMPGQRTERAIQGRRNIP
jgi:hypothetical protein